MLNVPLNVFLSLRYRKQYLVVEMVGYFVKLIYQRNLLCFTVAEKVFSYNDILPIEGFVTECSITNSYFSMIAILKSSYQDVISSFVIDISGDLHLEIEKCNHISLFDPKDQMMNLSKSDLKL